MNRNKEAMEKAYSKLIKIAAEMAMCQSMPSPVYSDWSFPKGMQPTAWRKVCGSALSAENQCKQWAIRVKEIADSLNISEKE